MGPLPTVPEYRGVDRARFEAEIVAAGRPAVLRGLCAGWPLVEAGRAGPEALAAALRASAGEAPFEAWFGSPEIGGRFGYSPDFSGFNHDRRLATVDQLLDLLLRQRGHPSPFSIYAGAIPVARHLPGLMPGLAMPLLAPDRPRLVSLWLGNRTRTAAHWDLPQNLACVVAGRRRFTLFPTDQVRNLYVGPLDFTLAGQPISLVDVDRPDFEAHPRFRDALAAAETATLGPGDALYLPSLWFHAVESLDEVGAMVNIWWRDGPAPLLTPLNALYHAIMTMQTLPPRELAAWRSLFDHYVFNDHGDPAAHLPEGARGILGRRSAETVARLKALLLQALGR
ncbi:MAG: cupin-like domain-containing protein [Alphaproteobacteria bacterium]|nr:cupin-like domain-containing protein [Alphaproteobacteria bacterium]MBV9370875.1 cupin-like domain-containing protein [Alphaproteobacteria bacterium]MBV9899665.1 cupin-like domain-containing protein [Alphaproteobacteria bacterium]